MDKRVRLGDSMAGNRQVWLKSRPNGILQAENFGIRDGDIPAIAEGEFLVQNHYLSSDPAARGRIAHVLADELLDAMDGMEDRDTKSGESPGGVLMAQPNQLTCIVL
jgi:hypothetical protein